MSSGLVDISMLRAERPSISSLRRDAGAGRV
jgi:hypothetical protein